MEHSQSGESDASSSEEPNAKKCKRDPNAQTHAKSVVILLNRNVSVSKNNRNVVLMPNTIEMAQLKKPDKGQYGKIPFTSEMTEMDVLTALHSKFPILRNKRLGCASAADNRTRLDFHGDKRIWSGALINRHTRGNSALYVLAEENHESEESQVLLEGSVLVATQRLAQLSQMSSTADQRHLTGNHNEGEPEMSLRGRVDLTTQADHTTGGILQPGLSVVHKMQNDAVLQTIAGPVAQASLKPVSTISGSQQREVIAQTSAHGRPLQQAPPAAAAAAAATRKNVPFESFFPQRASTKKPSVSERKREILPHGRQEFPVVFSASDEETSDSAFESMFENVLNRDTVQSRGIFRKITPCKGSTKGGDDFDILLGNLLPVGIKSSDCVAHFENCGTVHLAQGVNFLTLSGRTPKSLQGPGTVNVALMSSDGSWQGGEGVFEYIDDPPTFEEFLSEAVTDGDKRRQLLDKMDKLMSSKTPSDGQTTNSCGKTAPGSSSLNQSKYAWSVKLLQSLVYKAAEIGGIGGRKFIQMIFSTSAGKVIFNSYRNSTSLPEDIARTNGHLTLANYLQDVNTRLSKESNNDAGTESIDWLELKHAVDEEQSLTSGTDEAQILKKCQPLGYPGSDDDERDYFADDEISPSSSPCHSNVFDSENEAQSQNSKGLVFEQEVEGQRAQLAYEKALRDGFVNVHRGRILLIGQDRAGKTSLKKSLLGLPFDPKEQRTEGIEVQASTCEIEVEQVKNWHSTNENKPGLQEYSRHISRIVEDKKLSDGTTELERGHSTAATEATAMREEDHFKEGGGLSKRNYLNNYQVDEIADSEISSPSRKVKAVSMQDSHGNNAEHFPECGSEIELDEPEVMINATSPPDDVTQHVHQFLEYFRGGRADSDISKEESVISLDFWDFPGQHLYYACHPLFFSSRALYILVHNLSKPLHAPAKHCVRQGSCNIPLENPNNETNLENLLSWLTTIHCITKVKEEPDIGAQSRLPYLRPPVLIVGTHADKPFEDITVMKSQIQKIISRKEYGKHVVPPLFCIDNTSSAPRQSWRKRFFRWLWGPKERKYQTEEKKNTSDIQDLRDKIMEVLKQEPCMREKIPVRWFLFEKVIKALLAQQIYHRHIEQLQNYAEKHCFMEDADEFAGMISFYHSVGMIVKHRSTVVLKPQWLIDLLRQLIIIPHFDEMDPVHAKYWQELERNGILCMEHIDHVFSKFIQQGVMKDDILDMMEKFGLIAKFSPSPSDVKYFVPAQLKTPPKVLCQVAPSHTDPCPLYIHFVHGFVPHGLFSQLVSRFICWCCKIWPLEHSKLYQNGAWFVIGKQIHDLIVIWKKSFIKIVLRQKMQSRQVLAEKSEELATQVREFVEETLQSLSQELPYLSGLQYELCVACPYCHHQGRDGSGQECSNHGRVSCDDEECFHLLKIKEGQQLICSQKFCDELCTVHGLEKWFLKRTSQDFSPSSRVPITQDAPPKGNQGKLDTALSVTLVASEWESSKGIFSTINRELAIELAQHEQVEVTFLVPQYSCSEEEKRDAESHKVSIREAERCPGYDDPLDWLSFPPKDLAIDIIVGHGRKLGKQAQVIRKLHSCKWVQVVHTAPEELGMYKDYPKAISKGEQKNRTEVDLCKLADVVVTVGPKLKEAYSSYLHFCKKHQDIIQLIPGTFSEFSDIRQATKEGATFKVLTFGRGDPEDFSLKGYDISAKAIVELKDSSYFLVFVGAPEGKLEKVAETLVQSGISRNQLIVRAFLQSKERLKQLFCEVDLAIMPSRAEGFGLTALEALSAGLPILVSGNSGIGDTLHTLPLGKLFVVDSADPKDWAKAIEAVRLKDRGKRLQEIQRLRTAYEEKFSWKRQCGALVEKMRNLVHDLSGQMPVNLQQIQCDVSKVSSTTDLLAELEKIASDKGFVISDNEGSGNCMFYALSEQLYLVKGIKILHGELRQSIVQYLRKNPKLPNGTDLFNFINGYQSWADYLSCMNQDGTWGDHVILYGTANCYNTYIDVISSLSNHCDLTIRPDGHVISTNPLVLGHVHEAYYVSLHPKQGLCTRTPFETELQAWQKPTEKLVCMLADHAPQKSADISTKRCLKDLPCKEREPMIRDFLCLTKLKQIDLADEVEKHFSPSEDHKAF